MTRENGQVEEKMREAVLYDPNPDPDHHHFRCRRCDRLYDVPVEGVGELRILGEEGFLVERKTVLLRGLCPACSAAGEGSAPRGPGGLTPPQRGKNGRGDPPEKRE